MNLDRHYLDRHLVTKDRSSQISIALFPYFPIQMNPYAQLNYDYTIFRNGGLPSAIPGDVPGGGPFPGGVIMLPAPEDQPFRPAFILDKEHVMKWIEACLAMLCIFLAIIIRSWFLALMGVCILGYFISIYMNCGGAVSRYYADEKLRWEGKLVRGPNATQLYMPQNLLV